MTKIKNKVIFIILSICLLFTLTIFYGPSILLTSVNLYRFSFHNRPDLYLVPVERNIKISDKQQVQNCICRGQGLEFQTHEILEKAIENKDIETTLFRFKGNKVIIINKADDNFYQQVGDIFKESKINSNYELFRRILFVKPTPLTVFMTTNNAKRVWALVEFKAMLLYAKQNEQINSFKINSFRGFQYKTTEKIETFYLFDEKDHWFSFTIENPSISDDEIDFILSTLKRI